MDKIVVTYALIRSCWDNGADYLDCFWPFILRVMPIDKKPVEAITIQTNLKTIFSCEIPMHSLMTVIGRAKQRRLVDQNDTRFTLTDNGRDYLNRSETEKQVQRRINALFEDIRLFTNEKLGTLLSTDEVSNALFSMVSKNIEPLAQFFNQESSTTSLVVNKISTKVKNTFVDYFIEAEKSKPEQYRALMDIWIGGIISSVLNADDISKVEKSRPKLFKGCQLFLDTNYVFSILGLHSESKNRPASELLKLIKEQGFDLKIFSFTVDEICRVIGGYVREQGIYPVSVDIDSVYSTLKHRGWTKTDTREFIINIEKKLSDIGISIEHVNIDLEKYVPKDLTINGSMQSYKPFQGAVQRNHDIAAIEAIAAIRNKTVHRIENSKALFLTSDHRLTRYNYAEMGHKKNSTIGEVISDTLLTNIIWLKNPNANISLSNIIMSQSQELLINRAVWQKFYENLKRLKQENRINDDTINGLFYGNYVEEELIGLDEAQVDDIDEKFVVDLIDKGRTFAKTDRENKEKDFIKALSEKRTMGRDESEQTWINKVTRVKNGIEEDAAKLAARRANLMATATSLVLLVACWALYTFVPENYHLNWLPTILLGGGGIWAIWTKLRNYLRQYFRERIYSSRVRLAHFEELVAEVDTPK